MGVLQLGGLSFGGALHVPGLLYTLISEPQLDKEGYEMRASQKVVSVHFTKMVYSSSLRRSKMELIS